MVSTVDSPFRPVAICVVLARKKEFVGWIGIFVALWLVLVFAPPVHCMVHKFRIDE